jgi:glutamine synthetase
MIRVPRISPNVPKATRIELRCPDPSCNPYLAFAVILRAGLDGIENNLPLSDPVEENLYHLDPALRHKHNVTELPVSLGEALGEMQKDEVVRDALGDHVFQHYLEAKTEEWDEYRTQITKWELERYLPIY